MATPINKPGIMIGSVMKTRTPPWFLMSARTNGKAAAVPMNVENTVTQNATYSDLASASRMTPSLGILAYQSVVKPAMGNPTRAEVLNDSRISTAIGAKRKI
jgi:hypothetical protein